MQSFDRIKTEIGKRHQMNRNLADELERCITYLETGASLDDYLREHPDLSPEVKQILVTASQVMSLQDLQVPDQALNRSRKNLIRKASSISSRYRSKNIPQAISLWFANLAGLLQGKRIVRRVALILSVTLLLILFSGGLVITSAKSLPGDSLYSVKRVVEDISIRLLPVGEIRNEYEENYDQQRVTEVNDLLKIKRIVQISFEGILQSQDGNNWVVSNIPVIISDNTNFVKGTGGEKPINLGDVVEVEGLTNSQGAVTASEIHLREYTLRGLVEKITGRSWTIAGIQLLVSPGAEIEADIQVGDEVLVRLRSDDNGLSTLMIERADQATSTPEELPSLVAPTIETLPEAEDHYEFIGVVDQVRSDLWVVTGRTFYISATTHLPGEVKTGDYVKIKYQVDAHGSYLAIEVEKIDASSPTEPFQAPPGTETEHDEEHQLTPTIAPSSDHEEETAVPPTGSTPTPTPAPTQDD